MRKLKVDDPKTSAEVMPAITIEGREDQLVALAVSLAEKQLREGTASSQVITHYLKLGTTTAKLEKEKLELENDLLKAKTKAYEDVEEIKSLYADALNAMKSYSGQEDE